jgi:hypothetical protein
LGGDSRRRFEDYEGYLIMMAHELLRQAALILGAGWSKGCDARDSAGRMVPLYIGTDRAKVNPEAVAFSPYGAICKAASRSRAPAHSKCCAKRR